MQLKLFQPACNPHWCNKWSWLQKSLGTLGMEGPAVGEAAAEVPPEADGAAADAAEEPQETDDPPAVKVSLHLPALMNFP